MKLPRLLVLALPLSACIPVTIGPKDPLIAGGEQAVVAVQGVGTLEVELLSITARDLVVLDRGHVVAIPLERLRGANTPRYSLRYKTDWNRLQPYCRYPQGLADAQWQELLDSRGQPGFIRYRVPPNE